MLQHFKKSPFHKTVMGSFSISPIGQFVLPSTNRLLKLLCNELDELYLPVPAQCPCPCNMNHLSTAQELHVTGGRFGVL